MDSNSALSSQPQNASGYSDSYSAAGAGGLIHDCNGSRPQPSADRLRKVHPNQRKNQQRDCQKRSGHYEKIMERNGGRGGQPDRIDKRDSLQQSGALTAEDQTDRSMTSAASMNEMLQPHRK